MQMYTDECRWTQMHTDVRRRTQMHADVRRRMQGKLRPVCGRMQPQDARCLFKDFRTYYTHVHNLAHTFSLHSLKHLPPPLNGLDDRLIQNKRWTWGEWLGISAIHGERRASNLHECYWRITIEPTTESSETEAIDKLIIELATNWVLYAVHMCIWHVCSSIECNCSNKCVVLLIEKQ